MWEARRQSTSLGNSRPAKAPMLVAVSLLIAGIEAIYLIRLSVVDDLIEENALHLLRLVPKAWITEDTQTRFENIPTIYGPVSVRFGLENQGRRLKVEYAPAFRHEPRSVFLHVPPMPGVKQVIVNNNPFDAKVGDVLKIGPDNR